MSSPDHSITSTDEESNDSETTERRPFKTKVKSIYTKDEVVKKAWAATKVLQKGRPLDSSITPVNSGIRFELPSDVRDLQGMTVREYFQNYGFLCPMRFRLYEMGYKKACKDNSVEVLRSEQLHDAIEGLLHFDTKKENTDALMQLVDTDRSQPITLEYFARLAALMERLLRLSIKVKGLRRSAEIDKPHVEIADFETLHQKIRGLKIDPKLYKFLRVIAMT